MGEKTNIEWTDSTWNPHVGCHKVSAGCKACYAERQMRGYGQEFKTVRRTSSATFYAPLKWKEPRKVFTCSWSDFFIEEADAWRDDAWDIIRRTPHLTYQILTKRPELIADRLPPDWGEGYPNVWLGVSIENEDTAHRLFTLARIPARLRFISAEPMLGWLHLTDYTPQSWDKYHWLIVGGESGPEARPMNPQWAQSLIVSARALHLPVFFKQMGGTRRINGHWGGDELYGHTYKEFPRVVTVKAGQMELPLG